MDWEQLRWLIEGGNPAQMTIFAWWFAGMVVGGFFVALGAVRPRK